MMISVECNSDRCGFAVYGLSFPLVRNPNRSSGEVGYWSWEDDDVCEMQFRSLRLFCLGFSMV